MVRKVGRACPELVEGNPQAAAQASKRLMLLHKRLLLAVPPSLKLALSSRRRLPVVVMFVPDQSNGLGAFGIPRAFARGVMAKTVVEIACKAGIVRTICAEQQVTIPAGCKFWERGPSAHFVRSGPNSPRAFWCGRWESNPQGLAATGS